MKLIKHLLITASLLACSAFSSQAITLTGFGDTDYNVTVRDFATVEAGSDSLRVAGSDDGSSVYGTLTTPISLSQSYDYLLLTGYYTGTSSARFDISLFDEEGNSLTYMGSFSAFDPGVLMTVRLDFSFAEGVLTGPVIMVGLISTGSGSHVDLTVDHLTAEAIPEPSTCVLIALGAVGVLFFLRRRKVA
jgi:hypothetical protein